MTIYNIQISDLTICTHFIYWDTFVYFSLDFLWVYHVCIKCLVVFYVICGD